MNPFLDPSKPENIEFPCPCCATNLAIPVEMAGTAGNCPTCQNHIVAPGGTSTDGIAKKSAPSAPPTPPSPAATTTAALAAAPLASKPAKSAPPRKGAASSRRLRRGPVLVAASMAILAGAGWVAYQKFAHRGPTSTPPELSTATPPDINSVEQSGSDAPSLRSIQQFLSAGGWEAARGHLLMPDDATDPRQLASFEHLAKFRDAQLRRLDYKPATATTSALTTFEATGSEGKLIFVVEETSQGRRIRWDALEQQLSGRFGKFSRDPGAKPVQMYVRLVAPPSGIPESEDLLPVMAQDAFPRGVADQCLALVPKASPLGLKLGAALKAGRPAEAVLSFAWETQKDGSPRIIIQQAQANSWASL